MKKALTILLAVAFVAPMFAACSDDDDYKCKDSDAKCIANCLADAFEAASESKAKKCAKCVSSEDGCTVLDDIDLEDDED